VLQNLALDWYPVWHYAVAIGYDLNEGSVTLRSGQEQRSEMPIGTFERTWARSGHWAMLALPPGRMPASVSEADYLNAVARLERAGSFDAARAAYERALERSPGNLVALAPGIPHIDSEISRAPSGLARRRWPIRPRRTTTLHTP
jgi:hypothetical protein